MTPPNPAANLPAPYVLADHPALDLLNTVMMVDGRKTDLLNSDEQAFTWLAQAGFGPASLPSAKGGVLLSNLRTLRDAVEVLVHARREERDADPSVLNSFLRDAVPQLTWGAHQPELDRFHHKDEASRQLARLAYSAAELLAEGDFSLVRKCESPDCSLMFYDRTKSHKRRWCSMALCGNRHKVAEFRKRRQGQAG
ncbi:CGNR zinc finger domain-containing protein [Pseudomonas putida]|uniref:Zinc finger CGNR domain-containing protein n=1 Tax=Pseudomonas putida TaxID=303 RepID=A0A6I6XNZ5_PSEPU|nr:ABATE domain-containing protein [Pseudomonas putida]QHG65702.1 hypothetical protein C2H86_15410 [Pseudomonas putida]